MPPCIGSHVDHQGKAFIVGHAGQLYAPRTFIDAWGRIRHTQKATKYRIVTCGCGQAFVAHDARLKTCEACKTHMQLARCVHRDVEIKPLPTDCAICGQPLAAQRRTKVYYSRACQQHAYRNRHQRPPVSGTGSSGSSAIFPGVDHFDLGGPKRGRIACSDSKAMRMSHGGD